MKEKIEEGLAPSLALSPAVIIVHLQAEVRRVYGDLHAERSYVTRKSCGREGVAHSGLSHCNINVWCLELYKG